MYSINCGSMVIYISPVFYHFSLGCLSLTRHLIRFSVDLAYQKPLTISLYVTTWVLCVAFCGKCALLIVLKRRCCVRLSVLHSLHVRIT